MVQVPISGQRPLMGLGKHSDKRIKERIRKILKYHEPGRFFLKLKVAL